MFHELASLKAYEEDEFYILCATTGEGCRLCLPMQYRSCRPKPLLYVSVYMEMDEERGADLESFFAKLQMAVPNPIHKLPLHHTHEAKIEYFRPGGVANGSLSAVGYGLFSGQFLLQAVEGGASFPIGIISHFFRVR